jgi:hypothetical protein
MIFDALLLLAGSYPNGSPPAGQAANGAGNILSTNTLDLASLGLGGNQSAGLDSPALQVAFEITSAPTGGTSVQYQVIQADDAALSVNVQVLCQTDAIPIASLPAGTLFSLNPGSASMYAKKRYFGTRVVNVGAIATHAYVAAIVVDQQQLKDTLGKTGFAIS